jgi:hypothetical protein
MAYDTGLAERIRKQLGKKKGLTELFDLTGRPMQGWILVAPAGLKTEHALAKWVETGATFAASLPKKK